MTKTFSEDQRKRYQLLKTVAKTNDRTTDRWIEALLEIDRDELWRIDNSTSMHAWALQQCPLSYNKIISAMRRFDRLANEKLIADSTGETVIRDAKKKKERNNRCTDNTEPPEHNQISSPNIIYDAHDLVSKKKPEKQLDSEGVPIPEYALPFWNRRQEVSDAMRLISELRTDLKRKVESADKLWTGKATQRLLTDLDTVYTTMKNFLPHTVCLQCGGHVPTGYCESCHGTGLISKFHMDSFVNKTDLSIRKGQHVNPKTLPNHRL